MLINKSKQFEKRIVKCVVFKIYIYRSLHYESFKSVYDF